MVSAGTSLVNTEFLPTSTPSRDQAGVLTTAGNIKPAKAPRSTPRRWQQKHPMWDSDISEFIFI
jgi:hypothetical protein